MCATLIVDNLENIGMLLHDKHLSHNGKINKELVEIFIIFLDFFFFAQATSVNIARYCERDLKKCHNNITKPIHDGNIFSSKNDREFQMYRKSPQRAGMF